MATFRGKAPRAKSSVSKPKMGNWSANIPGMANPDPRPIKPPSMGKPRGVVPASYKAEHQAEWDAASHKERMAMRKAAPRVKPKSTARRRKRSSY